MTFAVRSRKFCCFLPVRLGVFVLSLFTMIGGSFVGAIGWLQVSQLQEHPLETSDEIALFIHSSIFSLLGVLAILGFVGSLIKLRGMVIGFSIGLAIHLGLSIGSGVFTMYSLFRQNSAEAVEKCLNGATDNDTKETCQNGIAIVKGAVVAIYVIAWLVELYAYFIVERYAEQLEEEEIANLTPIMPQQISHPMSYGHPHHFSYSAYGDTRQSYGEPYLPQEGRPESEYAFTLPKQAYGVSRGKDASNMA